MIPQNAGLKSFGRPSLEPWAREGWVCLDKNEAPFSGFSAAGDALAGLDTESIRTYPDPYPLYRALSENLGLDPRNLLLTFGSEQAIRFAFEAILNPGDRVVYPYPTFAMIDVFAQSAQASICRVEYSEDRALSLERLISEIVPGTRLVFLANPNNPTGTAFSLKELNLIASKARDVGAAFVLDEAYYHYCDVTGISLLETHDNVILTRTFSKAWGLAGVRAGYAVSNFENIRLLRQLKPIDEINSLSLVACMNALRRSKEILDTNIMQVQKWKDRFCREFSGSVPTSHGNFVLFRFRDSSQMETALAWFRENKILVKGPFPDKCMTNYVRFSITIDAVMERILSALRRVVEP